MIKIFAMLLFATAAQALPDAAKEFCDIYPESASCRNGAVDCSYCHVGPPALGPFGSCIKKELNGGLLDGLSNALTAIEDDDCDEDGVSNLKEILFGSLPGDENSSPEEKPKGPSSCQDRDELSNWSLCDYDPEFAFKRVFLDFCGRSPSFKDMESFRAMSDSAQRLAINEQLDECMQTAYFRGPDGFVWKLAHEKIRPLRTIKSGANDGPISLGDYDDDYHLFVYHHLDDRDVRGLLTAQYFVVRDGLEYTPVNDVPLHPEASGVVALVSDNYGGGQQFVPKDKRAGMLTTMWFAVNNTMFTSIPRTTAAQALRAYLDTDLAKSEGLIPPSDPDFKLVDHDSKGITDPACSFCHAVLDPASYPFSKYNGLSFNVTVGDGNVDIGAVFDDSRELDLGIPAFIPQGLITAFINRSKTLVPGMYKERRMEILAEVNASTEPQLDGTPEAGFLFGKPVANLVEWADVAANSNEFAKATVKDYWEVVVGHERNDEFENLWKKLKSEDGYSVRKMLHRLVLTEAYGAP